MLFLFLFMELHSIPDQLWAGLQAASLSEFIAVITGIISVWLAKKEHVWVYPVGLINTVIYIFISLQAHLPGEAALNAYYSVMSIVGWYRWSQKDRISQQPVLHITRSSGHEKLLQFGFFAFLFVAFYLLIIFFKQAFFGGAIPWADALASASGFTAMWIMTGKKLESWDWWIITNFVSVPLFFVKGYHLTALYYLILLVIAIGGLREWRKKADS